MTKISKLKIEARRNGHDTYVTGKPCCCGHYAPRLLKSGLCSECRDHRNDLNRTWGYKDLPTRKRNILNRVKAQAKMKGIEFSITVDDVPWNDFCPILFVPLEYFAKGGRKQNSVSIDRIDSTKGYVKGNVDTISLRANSIKSNLTLEQARNLVTYIQVRLQEGDNE